MSHWFIDTATLRVAPVNDTIAGGLYARALPPYTFSEGLNALLFADPVDSGVRFTVHGKTNFNGLSKTYLLFPKVYFDKNDTALKAAGVRYADSGGNATLDLNGYKSVSVALGGLGEVTIAQALDVRLHGDIAANTRLEGHISDQGSSLDGSTREVNELDMVYLQLTNPHFGLVLGDQYLSWIEGGMLAMNKKIKGIAAQAIAAGDTLTAFAAISSGKFASQLIRGRSGMQGPYQLIGNNEAALILPQHGTVKVWLNGDRLLEGVDVTVDYELGTVTVDPRRLVGDNDILRVEYEYRVSDYQRLLAGVDERYASADSHFIARGTLWYESDNKDVPLDLVLDQSDIARCAAAGNGAPLKISQKLIPINDVASENALTPLYRIDSGGHFVYAPYNPQDPQQRSGFYHVWFRALAGGDYAADSSDFRGPIYRYVGAGLGTATPTQPIPLPERTVTGEIKSSYRPFSWIAARADLVGRNYDRNLFSMLDKQDNNSAAASAKVLLGTKSLLKPGLWAEAGRTFIGRDLNALIFKQTDRGALWDDTSTTLGAVGQNITEGALGGALRPNLGIECDYGRLTTDNAARDITDRLALSASAPLSARLTGVYAGNFFWHTLPTLDNAVRKDNLSLRFTDKIGQLSAALLDEWRRSDLSGGRGMAGGALTGNNKFLQESLTYLVQRKGGSSILSAADSGTEFTWTQALDGQLRPDWHAALNTNYHRKSVLLSGVSSVALVSVTNDYALRRIGLHTRQEYSLTSEQAGQVVAVPTYVGAGLGNYAYSDSAQEYVPRAGGNFILNRTEVADAAGLTRMQKTRLMLSYTFDAPHNAIPGILGDIAWQGELQCEENTTANATDQWRVYFPGLKTLTAGPADTAIRYSQCSFRQRADWAPPWPEGPHGFASVKPYVNFQTRLAEQGLDWHFGADKHWGPWFLESDLALVGLSRSDRAAGDSVDNARITDRSLMLGERRKLGGPFSLFCKQYGGWAQQSGALAATAGFYARVQPGVSAEFSKGGRAELSYALSQVALSGNLDWHIAQGFRPGLSHVIEGGAAILMGSHFSLEASLRSEFGQSLIDAGYKNGLHTVSVSGRAYL
ncbi:MAG: hypothetical protein PHC61_04590 [Chitinivibrionales bacterium]|nr:hypothetical protein [Chitinivibrionales bacterium]